MNCKVISGNEDYEKFKNDKVELAAGVGRYDMVLMPYSVFVKLVILDKSVEEACERAKKEKENDFERETC